MEVQLLDTLTGASKVVELSEDMTLARLVGMAEGVFSYEAGGVVLEVDGAGLEDVAGLQSGSVVDVVLDDSVHYEKILKGTSLGDCSIPPYIRRVKRCVKAAVLNAASDYLCADEALQLDHDIAFAVCLAKIQNCSFLDDTLKESYDFAMRLVPFLGGLQYFSKEIQEDRTLQLCSLRQAGTLSNAQRCNLSFMMEAVVIDSRLASSVDGALRSERRLAEVAVMSSFESLQFFPLFSGDASLILKAVWVAGERFSPEHLKYVDSSLKNCVVFAEALLPLQPLAYSYMGPAVMCDPGCALLALRHNSLVASSIPDWLYNDADFTLQSIPLGGNFTAVPTAAPYYQEAALLAVQYNPSHYWFVNSPNTETILASLKGCLGNDAVVANWSDTTLLERAVENSRGRVFQHISEQLRGDKDFVLRCVRVAGRCLEYAVGLCDDEEVVEAAVTSGGLRYVKSAMRTEDIVLKAVCSDPLCLKDVPEHAATRCIVDAAISRNGIALQYAAASLQADADVVASACKLFTMDHTWRTPIAFASMALRCDAAFAERIVRVEGDTIVDFDCALRGSLLAVALCRLRRCDSPKLVFKSTEQNSVEVQRAAVRTALPLDRYSRTLLYTQRDTCLEAYAADKPCSTFRRDSYVPDREFMLEAVARCGNVLRVAPFVFRDDIEVVRSALRQDHRAALHASTRLRGDAAFCKEACALWGKTAVEDYFCSGVWEEDRENQ